MLIFKRISLLGFLVLQQIFLFCSLSFATQLIAPSTGASNSDDFLVSSSVNISCYGASGSEFVATIMQKNSDGSYGQYKKRKDDGKGPVTVVIDGINTSVLITNPGTYQVDKGVTVGTVGIDIFANTQLVDKSPHSLPETSVHMARETGITDTFAVASSKNDLVITVTNGAQWSAGNKIKILDGDSKEYDILKIISISTNDLTLDRQLDAAHPIGEDIVGVDVNMALDGSSTSVVFDYTPDEDQIIHVHTVHVTMSSSTEPGLERFGGMVALPKGVHFRVKNTTGRDSTYWIPFRANNSFVLSGFKWYKEAKLAATWFWHMDIDLYDENDSVIELDGGAGQSFQLIVQDDLTGLLTMEVKLGVHEEPR